MPLSLSILPSVRLSILPSIRPPIQVGTLWEQLLLQFYTDSFEIHWYFGHGLKICMWFGYNPQIFFVTFFRKLNLDIFRALSLTM